MESSPRASEIGRETFTGLALILNGGFILEQLPAMHAKCSLLTRFLEHITYQDALDKTCKLLLSTAPSISESDLFASAHNFYDLEVQKYDTHTQCFLRNTPKNTSQPKRVSPYSARTAKQTEN